MFLVEKEDGWVEKLILKKFGDLSSVDWASWRSHQRQSKFKILVRGVTWLEKDRGLQVIRIALIDSKRFHKIAKFSWNFVKVIWPDGFELRSLSIWTFPPFIIKIGAEDKNLTVIKIIGKEEKTKVVIIRIAEIDKREGVGHKSQREKFLWAEAEIAVINV